MALTPRIRIEGDGLGRTARISVVDEDGTETASCAASPQPTFASASTSAARRNSR